MKDRPPLKAFTDGLPKLKNAKMKPTPKATYPNFAQGRHLSG